MSHQSLSKWAAVAATGLAGTMTGSLAFVSFVDTRSFLQHLANDPNQEVSGKELVRRHFAVWWPCGRDWMVPLLGSAAVAHAVAWRTTRLASWGMAGLAVFLVGPYTAVVLKEDIEALRASDGSQVEENTRRFCWLHHVRLGLAFIGFAMDLVGLTEL